jgi:hypothetical protein
VLSLGGLSSNFKDIHATCANVLLEEVGRMEMFLFGEVRPHIAAYCEAFGRFLRAHGDTKPVPGWTLEKDTPR